MPAKIVQARAIRGDYVVRAYTAAHLVSLLNTYYGTSAADPNYAMRVTIQLLPIDYTFTEADLPLKVRSGMTLRGTGSKQTRLISAQTTGVGAKNIIEVSDAYSTSDGEPGRVFHVTLDGFTIIGDAYAPAGIYAKGLNHSLIHDVHVRDMTASGSVGVQLDAESGFGCYYNSLHLVSVGTAEYGGGAGSGAGIGFRLKTTDLGAEPKRVNANSLLMCSALYCVDAGYELNGVASCVLTSCESEQNGGPGLRVLNGVSVVVCGGYFENNASDIQLGELSGAAQPTQQTCLMQPVLASTTRLAGLSLGSTGDFYQVTNDGTAPSLTNYGENWTDKAYIGALAAGYIEFADFSAATRVGYFKRSADTNYRFEIYNDGTMRWGSGSAAVDTILSRPQANALQLADGDSFRLNNSTAYLIWGSTSGVAADVFLSRMSANILGLDNNDSFQLNSASGQLLWSNAVGTAADAAFVRDGAAGTIAARLLTQAHSLRVYNTWTDASNYERGIFDWLATANTLVIGTQKAGTGTARAMSLVTDGTARITIGATSGDATFTGTVIAPAATTSLPSIRIPHGTAPTSPTNGDIWTTTVGVFARINGATVDLAVLSGDMFLASVQTVTGAKTFNDTKLLLRNVADTFNGSFSNTNTANRVYTLQDADGTLAFTSDITGNNTGTNTGDQTITLTGDVTGSGTGTFAATIAAGSVDIAMLSATGTPSASTYLRGDNAWVAFSGFGDVFKVSTPVADQVGVWTGDGTLEGDAALTFDTATDTLTSVNFAGNLTGAVTATTKCTFGATVKTPQTYSPSASGTATLDCALGDVHRITMPAGNITIALSSITNGQSIQIAITQDATGSRTVTWFSTIRWAGGSAPTLTTTASKRDVIVIHCTGSGTYDGFVAGANI